MIFVQLSFAFSLSSPSLSLSLSLSRFFLFPSNLLTKCILNCCLNQIQILVFDFTANSQPMQTRHNRDSIRSQVHKQHSEHKPTRVRTVLNEKQLTTLRNCYNANPRPDALLKERLVEMTGLSARVIRVWFQNKRCKDKKKQIMMKQIQQQEKVRSFIYIPLGIFFILLHTFHTFEALILLTLLDLYTSS